MQAFKYDNPGSLLEDFVRWYSPNDWLPDEVPSTNRSLQNLGGHLSDRMLVTTRNLWRDIWEVILTL